MPRNPRPRNGVRAVDRRAAGLTADYLRKAKNTDQGYCGTPQAPQDGEGQVPRVIGPVEQRLISYGEVKGWCFGAWGEASEEVHSLVQRLATSRAEVADTLPHQRGTLKSLETEKAGLVGYLRHTLSFTARLRGGP